MTQNETTNLFFIGDYFYTQSGTFMSPIYVEGTWERFDWGFVQRDLRAGKKVNIRPATDAELGQAYRMLQELKERNERRQRATGG